MLPALTLVVEYLSILIHDYCYTILFKHQVGICVVYEIKLMHMYMYEHTNLRRLKRIRLSKLDIFLMFTYT
jgi:hypothetical protein